MEENYTALSNQFVTELTSALNTSTSEISERNTNISERDLFIYGDGLNTRLKIPRGHDFTPVNWLRRTIEIHRTQFMGRGFQMISTYDTDNIDTDDPKESGRLQIENDKKKLYAEMRKNFCDAVMKDNGGNSLWAMLAESAGAAGDAAVKCYYDEKQKKYVISPIETIENLYVIWSRDDFRAQSGIGYVYQIPLSDAIKLYNVPENTPTSPIGQPLVLQNSSQMPNASLSSQQMVTVLEYTGRLDGWGTENGKVKRVKPGKENAFNVVTISNCIDKIIDDEQKMPKYYILPNKRQRRRPWGVSDVSDAAININLTYIETLSDWRTVASKVNFPKYKAYGFGKDSQTPKPETRAVQIVPLAEGQDIVPLAQEDANQIDFRAQMDELKEQFVRETGISRVLFDDPSVTLNSNQALLTSMKPTSDIAEAKKQLWTPVLIQIFSDALETMAKVNKDLADLVDEADNWTLKIVWPSVLQKEDPTYQSMLLNRFNAGLMSVQSYMEAQGDSAEEIDRIKDEITDPVTSAMLGHALPLIAQVVVNAGTAELQAWYQASMPQPEQPQGGNTPGVDSNGGTAAVAPTLTEGENTGAPVSQPGTGATTATAEGALAMANQNAGI